MKLLIFNFLICISIQGYSQNPVVDISWNNGQCKFTAEPFSVIFASSLKMNQIDSARTIIKKWENNCSTNEPVQRAKIILALKTNSFDESIYDKNILENIINFDNRLVFSREPTPGVYYSNYQTYFGFIPLNSYFDQIISETASGLKNAFKKNSCADLFTKLYSNEPDSFFIGLKDPATDGTQLKTLYQNEISKLIRQPVGYIGFYLGSLIPAQKKAVLGVHPVIGAKLGIKQKKITYNLIFEGRFGDTRQPYTFNIKDKDSLITTKEYLGALIGAELGYELLRRKSFEISVVGGGGYEMVRTMIYPEDYKDDVTINTYNINAGLCFRKYINSYVYLDLIAKYNYADYTLGNQSDLRDNYFSVSLLLGYFGSKNKDARLKKLRYY